MGWFTNLLTFLAALMDYYRTGQLIDAGKNKEKLDVLEKSESDRKKAKDVKAGIDSLSADAVVTELSKYKRKK